MDSVAEQVWTLVPRPEWHLLFELVDWAAAAGETPLDANPFRDEILERDDFARLKMIVDHPIVGAESRACSVASSIGEARKQLSEKRCAHLNFFFSDDQKRELPHLLAAEATEFHGRWAQASRQQCPKLFDLFEEAMASTLAPLVGFEPSTDQFTLTISLQSLKTNGIPWHRDLYWPKEWVGRDVFAVFYALDSDSKEKGGAFINYVSHDNEVFHHYRRMNDVTVIWNGRTADDRPLHAVSGFRSADTSRHLIILQCLVQRPNL